MDIRQGQWPGGGPHRCASCLQVPGPPACMPMLLRAAQLLRLAGCGSGVVATVTASFAPPGSPCPLPNPRPLLTAPPPKTQQQQRQRPPQVCLRLGPDASRLTFPSDCIGEAGVDLPLASTAVTHVRAVLVIGIPAGGGGREKEDPLVWQ